MGRFAHFQSFRSKLVALVLLASALTAMLVGGTLLARNHFKLRDMAVSHLLAEADVVALQSARPLWSGDVESAERKLSALAVVDEIGAVCIYDLRGQLFAQYVRANGELPELEPGFGKLRQPGWLVIEQKPIEYDGIQVGTLEIAYDLQPINQRLKSSVLVGATIASLAALLSILVSFRLQRALARPITSLSAAATHVANSQDFSHRARKYSEDELGTLTSVFNSMLDEIERSITERAALLESERAARAEAERATRIKDEFVATLSHELRTPLAAILGWTQMLRRQNIVSSDQADQALETIERNTRLQMKLVEDLLDMSRILSGKLRLDIQPVALETVIEAAIATVELAATAKRIDLVRRIEPQVGPVLGDSGRLQQVVWNLLSNAVKFTPAGGRVSVSLATRNGHAIIDVSDTGHGIEPAFLPQVFDRFSQSDTACAGRNGGLGLGLAIVKQIVELHGGVIRAASKGIGRGSTFTVELPLATPDQLAGAASLPPAGAVTEPHQPGALVPSPPRSDEPEPE